VRVRGEGKGGGGGGGGGEGEGAGEGVGPKPKPNHYGERPSPGSSILAEEHTTYYLLLTTDYSLLTNYDLRPTTYYLPGSSILAEERVVPSEQ